MYMIRRNLIIMASFGNKSSKCCILWYNHTFISPWCGQHCAVFIGTKHYGDTSQLTHNVLKTLLESFAELVWDKRCRNLVATFYQIYFVWQWKWVISNVVTTLQQRYLATYNVAATLFGNMYPTFAQSCHSTLWQRSRNFPGLRFHNFHSMLWERCYNLKLLAGIAVTSVHTFICT